MRLSEECAAMTMARTLLPWNAVPPSQGAAKRLRSRNCPRESDGRIRNGPPDPLPGDSHYIAELSLVLPADVEVGDVTLACALYLRGYGSGLALSTQADAIALSGSFT
ncbi:MAG: hypothetical protein JWO80_4234 [Bryobacterales bacterium]|nr:hypothetical protein [Bryobacterales bacterium]